MRCVICKQGVTHKGASTITFEQKETTLVIKDVPSDICENCGETYFAAKITDRLLKVAHKIVRTGVRVDIRDYVAA